MADDARVPRHGDKGLRRRRELLEAVIRLVERGGLEAVSYRAVAVEAGVPAASISYYFDGLEAMVDEALEDFVANQIERLEALELGPGRMSADELAAAVVAALWDQRAGVRAQFALYLAGEERPALRGAARRCVASYERLAHQTLSAAGIAGAEALAPVVVALIDGMALRRPSLGREEAERQTVAALLALVASSRR